MRYATLSPSASRQARSRRIGRCARCHAPVLADEEHYGTDAALVHGACRADAIDTDGQARSAGQQATPRAAAQQAAPHSAAQQARRTRRVTGSSLIAPYPTAAGKV
ncbi:MAG TPA: hypothetical protein VFR49_01670 [Solirubrobacteraceae bacterium]|nr:hypothetical protein [Solirubrobacteraceae bacterium]